MSTDHFTSRPPTATGENGQSPTESVQQATAPRVNAGVRPPQYTGVVLDRRKLAAEVAAHAPGLDQTAALQLVDVVFTEIMAGLRRDGDVHVPGFGRFQTKRRVARKGTNPNTGQPINIPPKSVVTFRPATRLLDRVFDHG